MNSALAVIPRAPTPAVAFVWGALSASALIATTAVFWLPKGAWIYFLRNNGDSPAAQLRAMQREIETIQSEFGPI